MNSKMLTLVATLGFISTPALAEENIPTFSAGISSFAIAQDVSNGYASADITYTGLQFLGAANINDNLQAQMGFYNTSEEDFELVELSGYSVKLNMGKGFQNKGLKAYGTLGFFNEKVTIKGDSSFKEKASGLEFGAGIGYNFEVVSLDYGFTIRTSSDYETDNWYGSETDVTTATGYLALSANF